MTAYELISKWFRKIPQDFWTVLGATFFFGLFTHLYVFTNTVFLADAMRFYDYQAETFWGVRWFANVLQRLIGSLQMPWVIGLWELVIYTFAAYCLCKLFGLRHTLSQALCAAVVVMFPVVTVSHAYLSSGLAYAFSFFAAVFSVYVLEKWKNPVFAALASVSALFLLASTYQPELCTAATLMLVVLILKIIAGGEPTKKLLLKGLWFAGCLAAAAVLFYLAAQALAAGTGAGLSFRGVSAGGVLSRSLMEQVQYYLVAAYGVWEYFSSPASFGASAVGAVGYQVIFLLGLGLSLYHFIRHRGYRKVDQILLLVMLLLALPLSIYTFSFVGLYHHGLMRHAFLPFFIYVLWLAEISSEKARAAATQKRPVTAVVGCLFLAFAVMLYSNWTLANTAYLSMQKAYQVSLQLANRVVYEMESTEGYSNDMPVVVIGIFGLDNYPPVRGGVDRLGDTASASHYLSFFHTNLFLLYLREHLGVMAVQLPEETETMWRQSEAAAEMPMFPEDGYVQIVDGVMLVHLGQEDYTQNWR